MDKKNIEIEKLEGRLRILHSMLQAENSDIGDWKLAKCLEYQMCGLDLPYDVKELNSERQKVRDEINDIETELNKLREEIE